MLEDEPVEIAVPHILGQNNSIESVILLEGCWNLPLRQANEEFGIRHMLLDRLRQGAGFMRVICTNRSKDDHRDTPPYARPISRLIESFR